LGRQAKEINAYAKVENQAACCSPSMEAGSPFQVIESACRTPAAIEPSLHEELTTLFSQYDVNAAAASVKVYAVKPVKTAQIRLAVTRPAAFQLRHSDIALQTDAGLQAQLELARQVRPRLLPERREMRHSRSDRLLMRNNDNLLTVP
jgi:hypothetical protein